jgi:anhydro-N-acetylmuramic acid kinase
VGDFRPADIAAGGQGAPLVPWVDYFLYRDERIGRAVLNIGGIANFTVIPRASRPQQVFAFDTGPGNMLVDGLVRQFSNGREQYDKNARRAIRGKLLPALLQELLSDPYFKLPPPKSAGREQYGQKYVQRLSQWAQMNRARAEDLVHTVTLLTPLSIAGAIQKWVLPRVPVQQVLVSGGGARNPLMMAQLAAALPKLEVIPTESLGLPGDAKEAFAFALLANETLHRRPANLPSATGAKRPAILGKICYPPPR